MTTRKHTPGPWITKPGPDPTVWVGPANSGEFDIVATTVQGNDIANAHLIAAAPELLAALEDIASDPGVELRIVEKALSVIAKATGGEGTV